MRMRAGMTPAEAIVVLVVCVLLAGLLFWLLNSSMTSVNGRGHHNYCMVNLSAIGKAIVLYKGANDNKWPWIENVRSDWSNVPTGTNRQLAPNADPNNPGQRSITALMFLLVRDNQPAKLFTCPSDRDARYDVNTRYLVRDDDPNSETFYWDFSAPNSVSYSWQAPVFSGGRYVNGLDDEEPNVVVIADKTPRYGSPNWQPDDMSKTKDADIVRRNMSQNHRRGSEVNALMVGMNVVKQRRPDFALGGDNIYTASGEADAGSRSAVSLDMADHLSPRDSFLIGPVRKPQGGQAGAGDGPSKAR